MAAARVQFAAANNGAGGQYQVSLASATTAGNLLIVCVGSYKAVDWPNLPDIQDNIAAQYVVGDDRTITDSLRTSIFYLPSTVGGTQIITISQSEPSIAIALEYSGTASLVDINGTAQSQTDANGVTSWQTPALQPTGSGVILAFASVNTQPASFAAGASYTLVTEQDNTVAGIAACVLERLNAAANTVYNPNGTVVTAFEVDSVAIAFK